VGKENTLKSGESSYRRYLNGEKSEFDEIIKLYREPLVYFLKGYVKSDADAEDIAADAFVELLIHPKRYSFKSSLKTYIFSIARHKACDFLRRKKREEFEFDENILRDIPSDFVTEEGILKEERNGIIRRAMMSLCSDYAEIIYLTYFEELGTEEIMTVMHKNRRQISNLLYRAKAALKAILENEGVVYDK